VGVKDEFTGKVDDLKYQTPAVTNNDFTNEMLTIKLRYKKPDGDESKLIVHPVADENISIANSSDNFRFSAAVASFGMLLRNSDFKQNATYETVLQLAKSAKGKDMNGYRSEFITLVEKASSLGVAKK
jgi:Ca-activated chloride channel family protein